MGEELQQRLIKIGLNQAQRHIFLCCKDQNQKCCSGELAQKAWEHLKKRLADLDSADPPVRIARSKASCLRLCTQGPIAVVYPEGAWYHSCSQEVLDLIIDQHLLAGTIVKDYCFAINPLIRS